MAATVTSITPRRATGSGRLPARSDPPRRPFRDNPRLILAGIGVLVVVLIALLTIARGTTSRFSPDFLSEFVLYALSAADLTMLAALVFVLARNIIKLVVERRRALPFARFRAKLVALLLVMTLVPTVLVLIVGSELIRTNIDRWFNAPMAEILSSANQIAGDYFHEQQMLASDHANRLARTLARVDLTNADVRPLRDLLAPDVTLQRVQMVEVYRVVPSAGSLPSLEPVIDVAASALPAGHSRAAVDRLAAQVLAGSAETKSIETLGTSGDLLHAGAIIRTKEGRPTGVVVATAYLTGDLAARSRRMTQAFESYNQLRVLKRPLTGLYLSFFLMVTLLILFGATWMGSYLAKRITRPVLMLSAAAREIGAGRLDQRVEPQSNDEFGSLVEAFNAMASELATSRRKVDRGTIELERKHVEVEGRRRYIETILERITTGVVSVDGGGAITTINSAAARLLSLNRQTVGQSARAVFDRTDLQPLGTLIADAARGKAEPTAHEIALAREGQELHLAAVATPLVGDTGAPEGVVLVLDDVTPLISRAEGGRVARGGAAAGARDQESVDADPAVGRAAAPPLRRRAAAGPGARERVRADHCRRGRITEGARRRVLTVRPDAGAADGPDRSRSAHHRHHRAVQWHLHRRAHRPAVCAGHAARPAGRGADPPRHHQPGGQRDRSDGAAGPDRR